MDNEAAAEPEPRDVTVEESRLLQQSQGEPLGKVMMPDDQPRTQKHLEQLKSLGLSEERAKEAIDSETLFYNDFIIIDKLESLSDEQEKLAKHSNWQNWAIIIIAAATFVVSLAVALRWP